MTRAKLFSPLQIGDLELANRIVIAPMCQYSAEDGCMTDWHVIHLGHLALSGAALLTIEATAVTPEGRITYGDVGLYSDRVKVRCVRCWRACAAGRTCRSPSSWRTPGGKPRLRCFGKAASRSRPITRTAGRQLRPQPSRSMPARTPRWRSTSTGLATIRDAFVEATRRATRLGLDAVQLHGAHGYLFHQFLSPFRTSARTNTAAR